MFLKKKDLALKVNKKLNNELEKKQLRTPYRKSGGKLRDYVLCGHVYARVFANHDPPSRVVVILNKVLRSP